MVSQLKQSVHENKLEIFCDLSHSYYKSIILANMYSSAHKFTPKSTLYVVSWLLLIECIVKNHIAHVAVVSQ